MSLFFFPQAHLSDLFCNRSLVTVTDLYFSHETDVQTTELPMSFNTRVGWQGETKEISMCHEWRTFNVLLMSEQCYA